jgi:hypothetical protein
VRKTLDTTDSGNPAQVLNGGVGNYNTERYVSRFFKELTPLKPTAAATSCCATAKGIVTYASCNELSWSMF